MAKARIKILGNSVYQGKITIFPYSGDPLRFNVYCQLPTDSKATNGEYGAALLEEIAEHAKLKLKRRGEAEYTIPVTGSDVPALLPPFLIGATYEPPAIPSTLSLKYEHPLEGQTATIESLENLRRLEELTRQQK